MSFQAKHNWTQRGEWINGVEHTPWGFSASSVTPFHSSLRGKRRHHATVSSNIWSSFIEWPYTDHKWLASDLETLAWFHLFESSTTWIGYSAFFFSSINLESPSLNPSSSPMSWKWPGLMSSPSTILSNATSIASSRCQTSLNIPSQTSTHGISYSTISGPTSLRLFLIH